ncbi:MAG: hypothetical protein IPK97_01335 [Ahniella sp.]|nr:hypothetical protein [Ahniella sp.]
MFWNRGWISTAGLALAALISTTHAAESTANPDGLNVTVAREVHRDVSRPMRDIIAELEQLPSAPPTDYVVPNQILDFNTLYPGQQGDGGPTMVQRSPSGVPAPTVNVSVDGMSLSNGGGGVPPDTTGDVGPNHFFQWVNTSWALFNKTTGARVSGPTAGNSFFAGFGGLCQTTNRGDPLVLFDDIAQRWVVSQFAFTAISTGPFLQCVAVSTSSDPLGTYNRYSFAYPVFNDYGKMGVWVNSTGSQNAYVFTMHEFNASSSFVGTSFAAIERDRMLNGQSAQFIRAGGISAFGALPFHLEGTNPMPASACPMFVHFNGAGTGYNIWDFCVNWTNGTTSFTNTPTFLQTQPFALGLAGIPQLNSTNRLDDFGGNSMYLAAVRNFGPFGPVESRGVITHSVDVGSDRAGARWVQFGFRSDEAFANTTNLFDDGFEDIVVVRGPAPQLTKRVLDEGTYAPETGTHRWMGSVNLDAHGNIGMGYNASASTFNPQIRLTGRERIDAAGSMRDEQTCTPASTGAQTGLFSGRARWGDYSTMGVDPADQCTFWFTGEYYPVTSVNQWSTRVCSFKFPGCGGVDFELEALPSALQVCGTSGAPSVQIRLGAFGNLPANPTIAVGTQPGGVTSTLSHTRLPPGGVSTITLNGAQSLTDGNYSITVNGSLFGTNRSRAVGMTVSAALANTPALTSPADNAANIITRPTLQWAAVPGATSYEVQIANDAGFNSIVSSTITSSTTLASPTQLTIGATYHWRVRSKNACGDSTFSTSRQFTTSAPGSCPAGTSINTVFSDDVSGDTIAWVTQNVSGDAGTIWAKVTPPAGTGLATRAWFAGNSGTTGDQRLTSPAIVLPATVQSPILLGFDAHHQYETDGAANCWDGGFVEISTDGGTTFSPLGNTRNLADPYPGTLSSGNPAIGTQAWCRQTSPGTPIRTWFTLDEYAGQTVRLRFRSTADSNTVGDPPAGWAIDNIAVQGCQ